MSGTFDPYYKWFGIPPDQQPPNHYQLLGVSELEDDADVIANAADQRERYLKNQQKGEHAEVAKRLLQEVTLARLCLSSPAKKAEYDRQLKSARKKKKTAAAARAKPLPQARSGVVAAKPAARPAPQPAAKPAPQRAATKPADEVPAFAGVVDHDDSKKSSAVGLVPLFLLAAGGSMLLVLLLGGVWLFLMPSEDPEIAGRGESTGGAGATTDPTTDGDGRGNGDGARPVVPPPAPAGRDRPVAPPPVAGGPDRPVIPPPVAGGVPAPVTPPAANGTGPGLTAELFKGRNFEQRMGTRVDRQIHFLWEREPCDPLVGHDNFSIRWTGWLKAPRPGWYRLMVLSDDGVRLWLDDELIIDAWVSGAIQPDEVEVQLDEQPHSLRLEYFESGSEAAVVFCWQCLGFSKLHAVPAEVLFRDKQSAAEAVIDPAVLYGSPGHGGPTLAQRAQHIDPDAPIPTEPVDLLQRIDPSRDSFYKQWWFHDQALHCTRGGPALIQVPCRMPREYELNLVIERLGGNDSLFVGVPGEGRQVAVLLDAWGGKKSGLDLIDGVRADKNETLNLVKLFTNKQPSTINIAVRKSRLTVTCDGKQVIDWPADYRRVRLESVRWLPDPRGLFLGTHNSFFAISKLELKPLSSERQPSAGGSAEPLPGADTVEPPLAARQKAASEALKLLQQGSDQPDACLTLGRWYCFDRTDWRRGLPFLAHGSDDALKQLAERSLNAPEFESPPLKQLADAWWQYAQSQKDEVRAAAARYAAHWYTRARVGVESTEGDAALVDRLAEVDDALAGGRSATGRPSRTERELPADKWFDVLPYVDLDRHVVRGEWVRHGDSITVTPRQHCGVMLPVRLEGNYELEVEFTRHHGDHAASVLIPVGPSECRVCLSGKGVSGLANVNGQSIDRNPTSNRSFTIVNGTRYQALIRVGSIGAAAVVQVAVDGKQVIDWRGMVTSLGVFPPTRMPDSRQPGLAGNDVTLTYHAARVRVPSGRGKAVLLGAGPPPRSPYVTRRPWGGGSGTTYLDMAPPGARLVGFRLAAGKTVEAIQPIYRQGSRNLDGRRHGDDSRLVHLVEARPGYAVGGIVVAYDHLIRGLQVIFMRQAGNRLDPTDTYESPWIGGRTDRPAIRDDLGGQPVVGIHGNAGGALDALGLIAARASPAAADSVPGDDFVRLTDLFHRRGRVGGQYLNINRTASNLWPWITRDFRFCDEFLFAHAPSELVYRIPPGAKSFTAVGYCPDSGSVDYHVLVDRLAVFESDSTQLNPVVPARVDLPAGARELTLLVNQRKDKAWDHSRWLRPRFHTMPVDQVEGPGDEPGRVKLTDLNPVSTEVGHGTLLVNAQVKSNRPVDLEEIRPCPSFITTHAQAIITFGVPDGVREFSAIGYAVRSATVRFCVFADGRPVYESPVAGIVPIRVPLPRDTRSLDLVVKPFNHREHDMAIWCYPRLHW